MKTAEMKSGDLLKPALSSCRLCVTLRNGFTMIEVTLALLVVAIGVLGAFSLIPAGLQTNRQAIADTQAAMFAESVFSSLRAQALVLPWSQVGIHNPVDAVQPLYSVPGMQGRVFYGPSSTSSLNIANPALTDQSQDNQNNIWPVQLVNNENVNIKEMAFNYRINVFDRGDNIKRVIVEVFPGEFINKGSPPAEDRRLVFYTEIMRQQ